MFRAVARCVVGIAVLRLFDVLCCRTVLLTSHLLRFQEGSLAVVL
jgi:hypothetical protein